MTNAKRKTADETTAESPRKKTADAGPRGANRNARTGATRLPRRRTPRSADQAVIAGFSSCRNSSRLASEPTSLNQPPPTFFMGRTGCERSGRQGGGPDRRRIGSGPPEGRPSGEGNAATRCVDREAASSRTCPLGSGHGARSRFAGRSKEVGTDGNAVPTPLPRRASVRRGTSAAGTTLRRSGRSGTGRKGRSGRAGPCRGPAGLPGRGCGEG